jgi:prevent-host-death family protein
MRRPRFNTDIKPVSEFRAKAADLIDQVRRTRRPIVLTQRGHAAAIVVAVDEYEQLIEELETLRDIRTADEQLDEGRGISNRMAKNRLRRRFGV